MKRLGRWSRRIHVALGLIMILMGFATITSKLGASSDWFLDVFPSLWRTG